VSRLATRSRLLAHARPLSCVLSVVAALCVLTSSLGAAAPRPVSFRTEDGSTLIGTWYEPSVHPAPAVILVHMLHRTRHDWDGVATLLADEGFGALSFDLRGHGDSQGAAPAEAAYQTLAEDVAAARRFVASRPDVAPARIGILGASLGANLAVLEAAQHPGIASLALLSASSDYRGVRIEAPAKKFTGRVLFVCSDDDAYAQRSAKELTKGSRAGSRETLLLSHAGHGTAMLVHDPTLPRTLVDWFKRTLQ
jgi:dienelactone hydrolase